MRQYRGLTNDGKWVKGWYAEVEGQHYILTDDCRLDYEEDTDRYCVFFRGIIEVIPETVGQSTNKKDKTGNEIYGGDRIKQAGHIIGGTKKEEGPVEQAPNGRWFVRLMWESGMECHADIAEDAEIVGNIHQKKGALL